MLKKNSLRYDSIDGLRAFAAIGIVMMHVQTNGKYIIGNSVIERILHSFSDLVFLFMIISGFSLCCGYYEKIKENKISVDDFYKKRYLKIWPFFFCLVSFDVVLSHNIESLYEAFANLTLSFALLPYSKLSVIGVGWTLGVIFLFYIIFPFFCFLLYTKKRAWFVFAISLIYNFVCSQYFFSEKFVVARFSSRTNFLYCLVFFVAGGLIYLYKEKIFSVVSKFRLLFLILALVLSAMYYCLEMNQKGEMWYIISLIIMYSSWIIYAIGSNGKILNNKFTKFVSNISMELYLSHMVAYRVVEKAGVLRLFGNEIISYITTIILTIGLAIGITMVINKVLNIFKKRFLSI